MKRTTTRALIRTESGLTEIESEEQENWKGIRGSVVFWLLVEYSIHHQK